MANKPRIRFRGFTEDWEQRKLGEVVKSYSGGTPTASNKEYYGGDIPFIRSAEINSDTTELYITQKGLDNSSAKIVEKGTILYAMYGATSGEVGISKINGAINQAILAMIPLDYNGKIIAQYLRKNKESIIGKYLQGGQGNLSANIILELPIQLPGLEESNQIANFLESFDKIITLHQCKLKKLNLAKKSLLQKLFPRNGSQIPGVRFKGFTDAWEQRKLIYIFNDFIVPMRDKPKVFSGTTPWTRIEDIEGRYINTSLSGQFVSDETIKSMNLKVIPKGSLIVSASATFGVVAIVNNDLITNQTFIGLVPNKDFDIDFLYSLFEAPTTKGKLLKLSAGSTIFYIARESFENLVLSVPSKEEQIKILKVFKSIDDSITLHQRKLERLQEVKKGLLQKMFV